jgi:hypothetical protein
MPWQSKHHSFRSGLHGPSQSKWHIKHLPDIPPCAMPCSMQAQQIQRPVPEQCALRRMRYWHNFRGWLRGNLHMISWRLERHSLTQPPPCSTLLTLTSTIGHQGQEGLRVGRWAGWPWSLHAIWVQLSARWQDGLRHQLGASIYMGRIACCCCPGGCFLDMVQVRPSVSWVRAHGTPTGGHEARKLRLSFPRHRKAQRCRYP